MNTHELPMILFTVIAQLSVGTFIAVGVMDLLLSHRNDARTVRRVTEPVLYAIGPALVLGLLISMLHMNDVTNVFNVIRHWESSWLSREILFGIGFAGLGFLFAAMSWFRVGSDALRRVVGLLTAQFVYDRYGQEDEGGLTVRRSHLASGRGLADLARRVRLGDYLRLGKVDEAAGGREKSKALTDAIEAVFGAAWCDGGLAAVQAIFNSLSVGECEMPHDVWAENPKGELQELAQRHAWPDSPVYEQVEVAGPSHAPVYTVKAHVAGGYEALGTGLTKRSAEAAAAKALLALLKNAGVA